jgi:fumarate reductase subunit D
MKTQSRKLTIVALGFALLKNPASAAVSLPLAQIPTEVKSGFQYGLGIIFMVGFIWGVINIWGGAEKMKRGDAEGKMGIVSGIIIAGAAAIMSALFAIFGLSDGALTPEF